MTSESIEISLTDPLVEIAIFDCVEKHPPVGFHEGFALLNIHAELKRQFDLIVPISQLKQHIHTFWNFDMIPFDAKKVVTRTVDFNWK